MFDVPPVTDVQILNCHHARFVMHQHELACQMGYTGGRTKSQHVHQYFADSVIEQLGKLL